MSRTAGLTLHWFGGVPTHDPTNNFKLYSRRFLDTVTIESTAGFELALELTVKATLARRRVAEVPRPGATGPRVRATSVSASGCPTTCTGTGWRCGAVVPPRDQGRPPCRRIADRWERASRHARRTGEVGTARVGAGRSDASG